MTQGEKVSLKYLEELYEHSRLAQSLPEEGDYGGIWNVDQNTKTDKLHKEGAVINLNLKLYITEVEKLMKNVHLKKIIKSIIKDPALMLRSYS